MEQEGGVAREMRQEEGFFINKEKEFVEIN